MDSTAEPGSDLDDLLALTRQFRTQLKRRIAHGGWAAPGSASARIAFAPEPVEIETLEPELNEASLAALRAPIVVPERELEIDAPIPLGRRTLPQIQAELGECTRCKLSGTRKSIVFGVGASDAPLMFVGEAPGEQEDRHGVPFVGRAGELLDKMIEAMGWTRDHVYITNVLMCRPPGNRNPQPDEVSSCLPFLKAKIEAIAPRVIVALGRPAANTLLGNDAPISAMRGKFHDRHGTKVMPTFHPAYLLREPDRKRDTWADLKLVITELARLGIEPPNPPRA